MLGGFLGAGKTTALARLAQHYQRQELRVGVVTNDQTPDLVDTHQLAGASPSGADLVVNEVAEACFCCQFDGLTAAIERIIAVSSLSELAREAGCDVTLGAIRSFRPGRPVPTHRLVEIESVSAFLRTARGPCLLH